MNLTRKHKIYLVVLASAAMALLVDQVLLGGGNAGQAHAQSAHQVPAAADARLMLPDPVDGGISVADRLAEFADKHSIDSSDVQDAFRPGTVWMVSLNRVTEKAKPENKFLEQFERKHSLVSVMRGSSVVVDNRCLRLGQKLDGLVLTTVTDNSATFTVGTEQVTLHLPLKN